MIGDEERFLVIGAGIVGLSCALFLQRQGRKVTLVDPQEPGSGASYGNAGILAVSDCLPVATPGTVARVPSMLMSRHSPLQIRWRYMPRLAPWLWRFVLSSRPARVEAATAALATLLRRARSAHQILIEEAGAQALVSDVGWIKAYETDAAFAAAKTDFDLMRQHGTVCEYLDAAEIQRLEPALAPIFRHAIYHPDCSQVADPKAYTGLLARAFIRNGGKLLMERATDIEIVDGRACGIKTESGRHPAEHIIVAAGAWSRGLAARLGARVPLDTERGYHLMLSPPPSGGPRIPVYWGERSIVLAPMRAGIRLTSSVEFAGLDAPPDFRPVRRLVPEVARAIPGIGTSPIQEWLGFRPSMPDSLPIISRVPAHPNCYFAFGHGHLGLTLGPVTGQLIAQMASKRKVDVNLESFRADRFH